MLDKPDFPLRVFYDGACPVCAAEIEHYGRRDREKKLVPVDISSSDFAAAAYGIPLADFLYQLHAIDRRGRVYRGVDAFWAIWQAFPASTLYGFLGSLVVLPGVNGLARLCYRGFARIRTVLPKRKSSCATGSCRIGKDRPP